jgi:hypothetical protein
MGGTVSTALRAVTAPRCPTLASRRTPDRSSRRTTNAPSWQREGRLILPLPCEICRDLALICKRQNAQAVRQLCRNVPPYVALIDA